MSAPLSLDGVSFQRPGPDAFALVMPMLEVQSGEVVALVGPSGSGKSTLLGLISGELLPSAGIVHVAGRRMDTLDESARRALRRESIGVVAQTLSLIDYLTGLENILLLAMLQGTARAARDRARELAGLLEVGHVLHRPPAKMSQGERQRIAICRALLLKPPVVLCDEPTGNLDAARGELATRLMLQAARQDGAAVLVATHDDRVVPLADRVVSLTEPVPAKEPV
ncbi:MAG: ATP-binding cassette domain-containing protein [Planctomycetota bacterium]